MITREQLLARREILEADLAKQREAYQQAQAQMSTAAQFIQALSGALQDVDYWLKSLDPPGLIETQAAQAVQEIQ